MMSHFWLILKQKAKVPKLSPSKINYLLFFLHFLLGLFVFYFAETFMTQTADVKAELDSCPTSKGVAGLIMFVLSSMTTIGFGELYPCTQFTKIFLIFYALVGVPLSTITVIRSGQYIAGFVVSLHKYLPPRSDEKYAPDVHPLFVPTLIVILVLLSAAYYVVFEHYDYTSGIIYGFYTFTLGDFVPENYPTVILMFITVLVGLSLVATMYEILQRQLQSAVNTFISVDMIEDLLQALSHAPAGSSVDDVIDKEFDQKASRMAKLCMTEAQRKHLHRKVKKSLNQRAKEGLKADTAANQDVDEPGLAEEPPPPPMSDSSMQVNLVTSSVACQTRADHTTDAASQSHSTFTATVEAAAGYG